MKSSKTASMVQRLPDFYTQDGRSVLIRLLDVFGAILDGAEDDLLHVMRSHWVDTADNEGSHGFDAAQKGDLDKIFTLYLENLGGTSQLKQLNRREGADGVTDDALYRARIKGLIQVLMRGASTVDGIISIVASNLGIIENPNATDAEKLKVQVARSLIRIVEFLPGNAALTTWDLPLFQDFQVNNPNPTPSAPQIRMTIRSPLPLTNVTVVRTTGGSVSAGYAGTVSQGDLLSFFADGTALLNGVTIPVVGAIPVAPVGTSTWRVEALMQSTPPPNTPFPVGRFDVSAFDTLLPAQPDPQLFVFDGPAVTADVSLSKLTPGFFTVFVPWDIPGFTERFDQLPDNPRNQIGYIVNKVKAAGVGAAIVFEKQFAEAHEMADQISGAGVREPFTDEQQLGELSFNIGSVQFPEQGGIDQQLSDNLVLSGAFDLTRFDTLNTFA